MRATSDTYECNCLDSDRARKKKKNTSRAGVTKTAVTWEADSQGELPRVLASTETKGNAAERDARYWDLNIITRGKIMR